MLERCHMGLHRKWKGKLPRKSRVSLPIDASHGADLVSSFIVMYTCVRIPAVTMHQKRKALKTNRYNTPSVSTYYSLSMVLGMYHLW